MLTSRSLTVAPAATLATITGILVAVLGQLLTTGAYWAITQVPIGSTYRSNAAFEAAFWNNFGGLFALYGFALVGIGLILFGWLAWKSDIVPNWLAILAFVGGVGGLLYGAGFSNSAAGILGFVGFILILITFGLWGIVIGARLLMAPKGKSIDPPSAG